MFKELYIDYTFEHRKGRELWEKINYFKELTYNFRIDINENDSEFYQNLLTNIRKGIYDNEEILKLNAERVRYNYLLYNLSYHIYKHNLYIYKV